MYIRGLLVIYLVISSNVLFAEVLFKIGKKSYDSKGINKENPGAFYDIEKKKYELVDRIAREKYLNFYWENLAKKNRTTATKAEADYLDKNAKVSEKEISETLKVYGDHPQLKKLSKDERKKQIKSFLLEQKKGQVMSQIVSTAIGQKELVIVYPEPSEPIFDVNIRTTDQVRYGPKDSDVKPVGCKDNCEITIVEYSEFECPYCARVAPTIEKVLKKYKGKIRWVMRDYPLPFHKNAKPAAVAAHCAGDQGKYFQMYELLFANQKKLNPEQYTKHARKIGLNMAKFKECTTKPAVKMALIEQNAALGSKKGVSGTPAFFVNGRRLSGAIPFSDFDRVIKKSLTEKNK